MLLNFRIRVSEIWLKRCNSDVNGFAETNAFQANGEMYPLSFQPYEIESCHYRKQFFYYGGIKYLRLRRVGDGFVWWIYLVYGLDLTDQV